MIVLWLFYVLFGKEELRPFTLQGRAQGTTYMIRYRAADSVLHQAEVDSLFRAVDLSLSLYEPHSRISRFNTQGSIEMDVHMRKVVEASLWLSQVTNGAFDITTRSLSAYWGFRSPGAVTPSSLRKARALTGSQYLLQAGDSLFTRKKGLAIDCNGIAQGYTVDLIAGFLEARGVGDYLVELGGEIRGSGRAEGGRKWTVGIEFPSPLAGDWRITGKQLELEDMSITTSGSYWNYMERGGKQYGHVIDPRTGRPVDNGIISVTVLAGTAMEADGLDNALYVMGWQRAMRWMGEHKVADAYFIYTDALGNIRDTATQGFYRSLK